VPPICCGQGKSITTLSVG